MGEADIDELALLEQMLCDNSAIECKAVNKESTLKDVDLFQDTHNEVSTKDTESLKNSAVHSGDTDSSDDEDKRNCFDRKYNDYGTQVKKSLEDREFERRNRNLDFETRLRQSNIEVKVARSSCSKKIEHESSTLSFSASEPKVNVITDVFTDPIFGLRIKKPLMSSAILLDRMQGKETVSMIKVKRHIENEDLTKDWVIAGVIVRKSSSKMSQKGSQFLIWTLSDLRDDLKTISLFLFRKAYNDLWKTSEGTVVAVLNPNVLDRSQNSTDQACLSIEQSDRVMILGQSKDLGVCKSKKKSGEPCTAFVNLSQCEHCIYHVKQEYQKFSKRQELQSPTMGKGLINKVLGKSTLIYGGKAYSATSRSNNKKIKEQDHNRLMSLSDYNKIEGDKLMINKVPYGAGPLKNVDILHSPAMHRKSDAERLNTLSNTSSSSQKLVVHKDNPNINSNNTSLAERVAVSPKLGKGFSLKGSGTIDLNITYGQKAAERTKANAIKLIQRIGGIEKVDPNNLKGTETGKKRAIDKLTGNISDENDYKRTKINEESKKSKGVMSERFKKILEASSIHQNLVKQHEDEEQEKYFNKLQKKEAMEEKMLNTFKLPCKAVRCVKCKYTAFSAAPLCKDERHPLKVLDTFKRFFKCADCNNRTVSLDIIPLHTCGNCRSSRWEKAPMLREKKTSVVDGLSVRGEEETYIGGQVTAGKNINLLVPDDS